MVRAEHVCLFQFDDKLLPDTSNGGLSLNKGSIFFLKSAVMGQSYIHIRLPADHTSVHTAPDMVEWYIERLRLCSMDTHMPSPCAFICVHKTKTGHAH